MENTLFKTFNLADYQEPSYLMKHVDLEVDLTKNPVRVKAIITLISNPQVLTADDTPLILDGQNMMLLYIALDNKNLTEQDYELSTNTLTIKKIPRAERFQLETHMLLGENSDLFGLYETEGIYLVKAETEGLRRVFYCIDRPDNLATYQTTIIANKKTHPILLSNGSIIARKDLAEEAHSITWLDELPKPSYLFALVAGNLDYSATYYTNKNNRELPIEFYVPGESTQKCSFAKEVLKKAIAWDEEVCQLSCDLAQHMVAGVDKYASGASEPTGLNLFNTENLYATQQIKTDLGILRVLEVVAHEYFHYWTGNRVTIRDWFNLTFKEGLTTFRAALFREALFGSAIVRLIDGVPLDQRAPRPSSYTAVRSLYTAAAYDKSAEIFRMIMLTMGTGLFYESLREFLRIHDGAAVTLEETLSFLSVFSKIDVTSFLPWFTESGIPEVTIKEAYDIDKKKYTLRINTQNAKNRPLPCIIGLLNRKGEELIQDSLLMITEPEMEFYFENMDERPILSWLRESTAPIYVLQETKNEDLLVLMRSDSDLYNRCLAAKKLIINLVQNFVEQWFEGIEQLEPQFPPHFFETYSVLFNDVSIEHWIQAELLGLVSEEDLFVALPKLDFNLVAQARQLIEKKLAETLSEDVISLLERLTQPSSQAQVQFTEFDIKQAGKRRLIAACNSYFLHIQPHLAKQRLITQFKNALGTNMTETISALTLLLNNWDDVEVEDLLDEFYSYWKADSNAINYWLKLQAAVHSSKVVSRVEQLMHHEIFSLLNPNKVYALLGTFILNPYGFHQDSGAGYQLVASAIISLDKLNPPLAANLTQKFACGSLYRKQRKQIMLHNLAVIDAQSISVDVKNAVKSATLGLGGVPG